MTCTITKEKNRITGEQWVWEYASACCTLAAGEVIPIQGDVVGDRLMLQTSDLDLTGCKTYSSSDLTLWARPAFSSAREDHAAILCRGTLSRVNFPAHSYFQALYTRNQFWDWMLCHRDPRESSWLFSLPQSKDGKDENTPDELILHRCWHLLPCYSLPHPSCSLRTAGAQDEGHVQT